MDGDPDPACVFWIGWMFPTEPLRCCFPRIGRSGGGLPVSSIAQFVSLKLESGCIVPLGVLGIFRQDSALALQGGIEKRAGLLVRAK